jgi:carboxymethylenebutenolidase
MQRQHELIEKLRCRMCFEPTARPPAPPRSGLLASSEQITLTAADGNVLAARLATTTNDGAPGVIVLPDVRGLHPYYAALADEFAQGGVHALAIDPYGRTAGPHFRDEGFDFGPHRAAANDAGVRADAQAAREHLGQAGCERVFALGFCFGGRAAFMQASQPGVAGVVGFYGWPARAEEGGMSPIDEARAGLVRARVLALYGGADENITEEHRRSYDRALADAGVDHETVVYPGAPHSFFDRKMSDHADACSDAWRRVLTFMGIPPN